MHQPRMTRDELSLELISMKISGPSYMNYDKFQKFIAAMSYHGQRKDNLKVEINGDKYKVQYND